MVAASLVLAGGCGDGDADRSDGGSSDSAVASIDGGVADAFSEPDGGSTYAPEPVRCQGVAPVCADYDDDRDDCVAAPGCQVGRCAARTLHCVGTPNESSCVSADCLWDGLCRDDPSACQDETEAECTSSPACIWDSTRDGFGGFPCGGIATDCSDLTTGDCARQVGCSVGCAADRTRCGDLCVDVSRDGQHCGACGRACGASQRCDVGECVCSDGTTADMCGACDDDPSNDCEQDCAGTWGGGAMMDECGTCDTDPTNDCAQDCAGAWGGTATVDDCGVCDADASNDCDCNGAPGGEERLDMCGTCDDDPSNDCAQDCSGDWGGDRVLDPCGVCDADPTNDCACDMCGSCDTDPTNDCVQDCSGTWGGSAMEDGCGACDDDPRNDCVPGCSGVSAYGACWFLGAVGQACTERCGGYAFYDRDTDSIVGQTGTNEACRYVLTALGEPGAVVDTSGGGAGCSVDDTGSVAINRRYIGYESQASFPEPGHRRACACDP